MCACRWCVYVFECLFMYDYIHECIGVCVCAYECNKVQCVRVHLIWIEHVYVSSFFMWGLGMQELAEDC